MTVYISVMKKETTAHRKAKRKPTTKMIGKRLATLRQLRGLSQSELSRRTGVAQNLISEYESGKTRMNGAVIADFVITLNVSADEMLAVGDIEERTPLKEISRKIMRRAEMLEDLEPKHQKHILRSIDILINGVSK